MRCVNCARVVGRDDALAAYEFEPESPYAALAFAVVRAQMVKSHSSWHESHTCYQLH